jgi:hypothetical protein
LGGHGLPLKVVYAIWLVVGGHIALFLGAVYAIWLVMKGHFAEMTDRYVFILDNIFELHNNIFPE